MVIKRLMLSCLAMFYGFAAFAVPGNFAVDQTLLNYARTSEERKPSGASAVKATKTDLVTVPNSLRLAVRIEALSLYFYPTGARNTLAVGYQLRKNLELGGLIGLYSSEVDEPKSKTSETSYGVWGTYYHPLGKSSLELTAPLTFTNKNVEIGGTTESDNLSFGVEGAYFYPLTKRLFWKAGLGLVLNSGTEKSSGSSTKVSSTVLSFNLSSLRIVF
jgi:hypothetical protein